MQIGERCPQPLATRLSQVPHSLIDDRGDANRGEAQDTFKRVVHRLGREPFHRTDVEAAQVLMRETISADERQSEAIRRDQTRSDAIRRNQTQSDAIRAHQMRSRTSSRYSCIESSADGYHGRARPTSVSCSSNDLARLTSL